MPVLAVAVGLYLPFELDSSIFIGGLIAWLLEKGYQKAQNSTSVDQAKNAGLLATQIIGTHNETIALAMADYKLQMESEVLEKVNQLKTNWENQFDA